MHGETIDTTSVDSVLQISQSVNPTETEIQDDFSPMQFAMVAILGVLVLMAVGAGIVITVILLLILFGLVSAGIVSTSILVGLQQKSIKKGFKSSIILAGAVTGTFGGAILLIIINKIQHYTSSLNAGIVGGLTGLVGGLILGFLAFTIIKRLTEWFKKKIQTGS